MKGTLKGCPLSKAEFSSLNLPTDHSLYLVFQKRKEFQTPHVIRSIEGHLEGKGQHQILELS